MLWCSTHQKEMPIRKNVYENSHRILINKKNKWEWDSRVDLKKKQSRVNPISIAWKLSEVLSPPTYVIQQNMV